MFGLKMELMACARLVSVKLNKSVFFLTLYDSINDMKLFWTVCITPQPCHSQSCCWLLPIWPKLGFWAKNGAYGLCQLGWRYNGSKLYFSWPYMIVLMMWNTSELSALYLSRATAIFVVDCCQFGPSWMFGLKMELMAWGVIQIFSKYLISLILSCMVIKKTDLLRFTANQFGTGHKLHFQPKNPARAKLAAINNKNGCGTAEV